MKSDAHASRTTGVSNPMETSDGFLPLGFCETIGRSDPPGNSRASRCEGIGQEQELHAQRLQQISHAEDLGEPALAAIRFRERDGDESRDQLKLPV
jgi:hypothetical protein